MADDPVSIVLLLRGPHLFTAEELRLAAQRAWGVSFAESEGSRHFVVQSGQTTLLKAGPHILSFLSVSRPYGNSEGNPEDTLEWLPKLSQRVAWAEHRAWVAVDIVKPGPDLELAYCVLAGLVAEMLDTNCTGVCIPSQAIVIPHDDSLYIDLQGWAASRNTGIS